MKKILLTFIFICVCTTVTLAQYTLTIKITNLRNNKGKIHVYVFDENQNNIIDKYGEIENNECTIKIKNLSSGKYAFKYFHDENNNDKLDCNWMKIPKEGYGFSNNAKGNYGPPSFEKWVFKINDHKEMICIPTY